MTHGLRLIAAILETGSVQSLRQLDERLFIDEEVEVFRFVRQHYRRYGVLPAFGTVEEELQVTLPPVDERLPYYLRRVKDRKLFTDVSPLFAQLREALKQNNMDEVRQRIEVMNGHIRGSSIDEDIRDLRQAAEGVLEAYDIAHLNPGVSGIPAGWPTFDERTGGYQNGDLASWVARMGIGKTYLMLQQAKYAHSVGYNVLVVTMEMTIEQITRRYAGMLAGINPDYIRKGMLSTFAERRLRGYLDSILHAERFNLYAGGFSKKVDDVEMTANEFNPDIIFVDGIYLMKSDSANKNANRNEKITAVLDDLKKMTITHNRPIVATTQFSRQSGKKGNDGSLENIAYTDAIGTHSSLVMGIKEGEAPFQTTRRKLEFLKGREGEHGEVNVNYTFAPMDFGECPPDDVDAQPMDVDYTG